MKNLIVFGAFVFVASQALSVPAKAGAERLLNVVKGCQDLNALQKLYEADKSAHRALQQGDQALESSKNFDGTCSQTAANSTYNSDTQINKLVSESKVATQTASSAVIALDAAIKQATPIGNGLGAVGAPKKCVADAKALPGKLTAQKTKVESAMKKLESCVGRASVATQTGVSTSTHTSTSSGISGKKPFLQRCMLTPNPQPGVNCKEDEVEEGETARSLF